MQRKNYPSKANIQFHFTGKTQKKEMFDLYMNKPGTIFFLNVKETEAYPRFDDGGDEF